MRTITGTTSDTDSNIDYRDRCLMDRNTCSHFHIYSNANIHANDYSYPDNHTYVYYYCDTYFCLSYCNG